MARETVEDMTTKPNIPAPLSLHDNTTRGGIKNKMITIYKFGLSESHLTSETNQWKIGKTES